MNGHNNWKILQIIPAQAGWKAVHCQESENNEIKISNRSIICWALVQPIGESVVAQTQVRGVAQDCNELAVVDDVIGVEKAGEMDGDRKEYLLGYNDPEAHKESDYWIKQGSDRLRAEKEKDQSRNGQRLPGC